MCIVCVWMWPRANETRYDRVTDWSRVWVRHMCDRFKRATCLSVVVTQDLSLLLFLPLPPSLFLSVSFSLSHPFSPSQNFEKSDDDIGRDSSIFLSRAKRVSTNSDDSTVRASCTRHLLTFRARHCETADDSEGRARYRIVGSNRAAARGVKNTCAAKHARTRSVPMEKASISPLIDRPAGIRYCRRSGPVLLIVRTTRVLSPFSPRSLSPRSFAIDRAAHFVHTPSTATYTSRFILARCEVSLVVLPLTSLRFRVTLAFAKENVQARFSPSRGLTRVKLRIADNKRSREIRSNSM